MNVTIKEQKIKKVGNSFYLLIPKDYIKFGLLDEKKHYDLSLTEHKKSVDPVAAISATANKPTGKALKDSDIKHNGGVTGVN